MKATVETQILIKARPPEVFKYLAHLKYHYLWNPQLRKISKSGRLKAGDTYTTESVVLGLKISATNTITVLKAPKELAMINPLGNLTYTAHFRLYPRGKKTLVKLGVSLAADKNFYMFTVPVLKQLALRELRTDLQALKIAVENSLE